MDKATQLSINELCKAAIDRYNEYADKNPHIDSKVERLNKCSAYIIHAGDYILLKSYRTIVAIYETKTYTMYDILRLVYGYTATSAQHIAKFRHVVDPVHEFRYYRV